MAELKTVVLHNVERSMAGNLTVENVEELVAEENMRIVGVLFGFTAFIGNDGKGALCRTGTFKQLASYVEEAEMETKDGVLFAARTVDGSETQPNMIVYWQMLPNGHYFYLEKGERIYLSAGHHNNSAATHNSAIDCIIFYY